MESINEWKELFRISFKQAKSKLKQRYPLEPDGSGNPRFVAIRKVIEQLPCAVKILELNIDKQKYTHLENDACPMIHYDFNRMSQSSVKYLGRINPSDDKFIEIASNEFHFKDPEKFVSEFVERFTFESYWESDLSGNIQFLYYDPRNNLNKFVLDFMILFDYNFVRILAKRFEQKTDYNKVYELQPDSVFSEEELLRKYSHSDLFNRMEKGKYRKATVEDFQRDVVSIQLLPNVNEHVRRVFDRAKKLYIFGWYVYDFFPVSHHYAVLALESAIKHRYTAHFCRNVKITNEMGKEVITTQVDHEKIIDFCKRNERAGWDVKSLKIDGEKFAYSMRDLLRWLVKRRIITVWERKICEHYLWVRNYLSHPTFSPVYPGGEVHKSIEEVAYLINKMFSSMQTSSSTG